MGMYDSVWIKIKCPYCGNESEIECQTKQLDCNLECWRKGDNVGSDEFESLDCIADCQHPECIEWEVKAIGYRSGFGRMFNVDVKLKLGLVTGEYKITSHDLLP